MVAEVYPLVERTAKTIIIVVNVTDCVRSAMSREASTQTHWSWLEDSRWLELGSEVDGNSIGQQTQPLHRGGGAELTLPPLNPPPRSDAGAIMEPLEEVQAESEVLRLPEIVDRLQAVDFGSPSSSETDEEGDGAQPPFPDIHASSLPSPAILHYLRESQSLASTYLSLGCDRLDTAASHDEEGGTRTCDFCGQEFPALTPSSMPPDSNEGEVTRQRKHYPISFFLIMPFFLCRIACFAAKNTANSACSKQLV